MDLQSVNFSSYQAELFSRFWFFTPFSHLHGGFGIYSKQDGFKTPRWNGARETPSITSLGYLGTSISVVTALIVAGVDFTGLAILFSALSVGIGFGLQNVVNNFVSGLILLFERPIKSGDWVSVGSTEGHVKIRIRSTLIQTLDRADVIVPNSELISAQVTNWMLRDKIGRVKVAIGVAYGSDTALVKKLLLEVAQAHQDVLSAPVEHEPTVTFQDFGASSSGFQPTGLYPRY